MNDPLGELFGKGRRPDLFHQRPETELILRQDPVEQAAAVIRDLELAYWFEPDAWLARRIARRCPACMVFSIPPEAILLDDLSAPPPWHRRLSSP